MRTIFKLRFFVVLSFLLTASLLINAQTPSPQDKKAAELKRLETGVNTAKAKVDLNERKLAVADSLITAGNQLTSESKTEIKAITSEKKRLDKDYATQQKSLQKLTTSKDKDEATQARADLKALSAKYKLDSKALDTRMKDATKKSTTGTNDLTKGKANKSTVKDALKIAKTNLAEAQKKYDAANEGEKAAPKKKK
jgi:hypothetical protein